MRYAVVAGILSGVWVSPTVDGVLEGRVTHYAPGLMEQVVANRGLDLAGYVGAVALNRRGDLFRRVWLEWIGGPFDGVVDGPFLVADCARRGADFLAREEADLVAEVSAEWAGRREFYALGPVPARVWFLDPAKVEAVR